MALFDNLFAIVPYKCAKCGARFRWLNDLKKHRKKTRH